MIEIGFLVLRRKLRPCLVLGKFERKCEKNIKRKSKGKEKMNENKK